MTKVLKAKAVTAVSSCKGLTFFRLKIVLCGLIVSIPVFVVCATSSLHLYRQRAFNQEDVIFGADPYYRSYAFAHGYGERSLVHPNLSNLVNPWVRVIAWPLKAVFPGIQLKELQMRVGLCISPLFAALTSYLIFLIAMLAGIGIFKAMFLSVLFGFSISTIVYGSVPDHFLISSFILSVAVLLLQLNDRTNSQLRFGAWVAIVSVAAGITITNMFPTLALAWLAQRWSGCSWSDSIRTISRVFVCACIINVGSWAVLNWIYGDFSSLKSGHAYNKNIGRIAAHWTNNPVRDFASFPFTFGQAFWGGRPDIEKIPQYPKPEIARYDIAFLYNPPFYKSPLYGAILLMPIIIVSVCLYLGFKLRRQDSLPFVAAVITFGSFNWVLHTFWGGVEFFLFSPHWHFASVLALVPLGMVWRSRVSNISFVGLPLVTAVANLMVWHDVLTTLPRLALPT